MNKSKRVAVCSLIAALSVTVLLLTRVVSIMSYACSAIAGLFSLVIILEYGYRWAFVEFAVTAVLSIFVAGPDSALTYCLLFGYYPIIKGIFESKIRSRQIQWAVKLIYFNLVLCLCYCIMVALISGALEDIELLGHFAIPILAVICNTAFVLYDFGMGRIVSMYDYLLRPRIQKLIK